MSDSPKRIQLRRTKGWRKPAGAVVVARPSRWGNPFTVPNYLAADTADVETARAAVVDAFRDWLKGNSPAADDYLADVSELAGHDLACWCPLDQPCHADVLLQIANQDG